VPLHDKFNSTALISFLLDQRLRCKRLLLRFDRADQRSTSEWITKLNPDTFDEQDRGESRSLAIWLMERLASYPYWFNGHAELARLALGLDDIRRVYASALAMEQLSPSSPQSTFFLGVSFLRRGSHAQAAQLLEALLRNHPEHVEAREELAAAYLVLGRESEVLDLLGSIPSESLTSDGRAALSYARKKAKEQSDGESRS